MLTASRLASCHGQGWRLLAYLSLFLTVFVVGSDTAEMILRLGGEGARADDTDFRVFWAAARLAVEGRPLAAFDPATLESVHGVKPGEGVWMPWLYPPGFLLALTPLGFLSFVPAWIIFTLLSVLAHAAALRPFCRGAPALWVTLAFAPALIPAITQGQNSLFWTAGLLATLAALRGRRDGIAGGVLGLMTLKPQLGLMIPFALLGAGRWRAIAAAILATVLVAALPTLLYGTQYWSAMLAIIDRHREIMQGELHGQVLMTSLASALSGLGLPPGNALTVQWAVAAGAAVVVALAWRRAGFDLAASILILATALATPYFWNYEAAMLPAAALFMLRAGVLRADPPGLAVLLLLWAGSLPTMISKLFVDGPDPLIPARNWVVPVILLAFALCLRRLLSDLRGPRPAVIPTSPEEH